MRQSAAFFPVSPGRVDCVEQRAAVLGLIFSPHLHRRTAATTAVFSTLLERTTAHELSGNRHVLFPEGVVTLVFCEIQIVHLIREELTAV